MRDQFVQAPSPGRPDRRDQATLAIVLGLLVAFAFLCGCSRTEPTAPAPEPAEELAAAEPEPSAQAQQAAPAPPPADDEQEQQKPSPPPPLKLTEAPAVRRVQNEGGKLSQLGPNVWLAVTPKERLVLVLSRVVLRRGYLEHLLCLTGTKEHEAILAAEIEPEVLHAALLAAGAEAGHPVQFDPEFKPPAGTKLEITVQWWDGKAFHDAAAREWIVHEETGKPMSFDWVFAGSQFVKNPVTGERYYLARGGDVITVVNMTSALIDVAARSSDKNTELMFIAAEEKIPPLGTEVLLVIRPLVGASADGLREPSQ